MNFTFWDEEISNILLVAPLVVFIILMIVVTVIFLISSHTYKGWYWSEGWDEVKPGAITAIILFVYLCIYGYFFVHAYDWLDKPALTNIYNNSKLHQVLEDLKARGYCKYKVSNSRIILRNKNNPNSPIYEVCCTNTDLRTHSSWLTIANANNTDTVLVTNGYNRDDGTRRYCVYDTDKAAEMRYINKLIYTHVLSFPTLPANNMCDISLDTTSVSTNCSEDSIDVTVNKSEEDQRNVNLIIAE